MEKGEVTWFALYTKPRWEKKVATSLSEKGLVVYCPLNKVLRQWSDRKKTVLEPLFKGYVFVQIAEEDKLIVKKTDGVVNFVYWNGKPGIVKDVEIETIRRFLNEFSDVEVEDLQMQVHNKVIIQKGLLVNYQGIILEVLGSKAKILIESMGIKLSATVDKKNLAVINP